MKLGGWSGLLIAAIGLGCGGQTQGVATSKTSNTLCEETATPVDNLESTTPLGFRGADLVAFATGAFSTPLLWGTPSNVTFGPEDGRTTLSLNVAYQGGPITFVRSRAAGADGVSPECADHLTLRVRVIVRTDQGALDEMFDADLKATTPLSAKIVQPLDLSILKGTFKIEQVIPVGGTVGDARLEAIFSPIGTTGTISGLVETRTSTPSQTAGSLSSSPVQFAVWPADPACDTADGAAVGLPSATSAEIVGFKGDDGLANLNSLGQQPLKWMDGSTSNLSLRAASAGNGCTRFDVVDGELMPIEVSFPTTISATTDDGRLNGNYPGALVMGLDAKGSELVSIRVSMSISVGDFGATGFVPDNYDVGGYQALALSLGSKLETGTSAGRIVLNGVNIAPCVGEPAPQVSGSPSTLPCGGMNFNTLEEGDWGKSPL